MTTSKPLPLFFPPHLPLRTVQEMRVPLDTRFQWALLGDRSHPQTRRSPRQKFYIPWQQFQSFFFWWIAAKSKGKQSAIYNYHQDKTTQQKRRWRNRVFTLYNRKNSNLRLTLAAFCQFPTVPGSHLANQLNSSSFLFKKINKYKERQNNLFPLASSRMIYTNWRKSKKSDHWLHLKKQNV